MLARSDVVHLEYSNKVFKCVVKVTCGMGGGYSCSKKVQGTGVVVAWAEIELSWLRATLRALSW